MITPTPPDNPSANVLRTFHLSDDHSHKFWSVQIVGVVQTVRFGRIGAATGQTCEKTFATPAEATAATERLIAQKRKKGYREVSTAEAECAAPRPHAPRRPAAQLALPF